MPSRPSRALVSCSTLQHFDYIESLEIDLNMHLKAFITAGLLSAATLVSADFEVDTTWDYGTATTQVCF